jgi:hypothetical protein
MTNATAIGARAIVNASNKVRIGDNFVTVIEGQVAYTFTSDRTKKENFRSVDSAAVLEKIRTLPLTRWNYIGHDAKQFRHCGPMVQDFYTAFGNDGLGTIGTPTTIYGGDVAGITLSAVQELAKENDRLREESVELKEQLAAQAAAMKEQTTAQAARDQAIEARLARLEQPAPVTAIPVKMVETKQSSHSISKRVRIGQNVQDYWPCRPPMSCGLPIRSGVWWVDAWARGRHFIGFLMRMGDSEIAPPWLARASRLHTHFHKSSCAPVSCVAEK